MNNLKKLLYLIILCSHLPAWSYQLMVMQPEKRKAQYLIPLPDGMSEKEGMQKILQVLKEKDLQLHSDTKGLAEKESFRLKNINIADFKPSNSVFVLLNEGPNLFSDMETTGDYYNNVGNFYSALNPLGHKVYFLPPMATALLNQEETQQFALWVARSIPFMITTGGTEAIDPNLYKERNLNGDKKINRYRDDLELALIRPYVSEAKGFLLGVCRGHQLTSALLGYKLIQYIPRDYHSDVQVNHWEKPHPIELKPTKNSILKNILSNTIRPNITSYHYQAVDFYKKKHSKHLQVAATAADGIIEALEFKNGKGLLLQFHPEILEPDNSVMRPDEFFPALYNYIFKTTKTTKSH